jgi:hypothetical protein
MGRFVKVRAADSSEKRMCLLFRANTYLETDMMRLDQILDAGDIAAAEGEPSLAGGWLNPLRMAGVCDGG